jgi:monoamine oxidase
MALGEEPERVSIMDYDRLWSGDDYTVPTGYGALVARTARACR